MRHYVFPWNVSKIDNLQGNVNGVEPDDVHDLFCVDFCSSYSGHCNLLTTEERVSCDLTPYLRPLLLVDGGGCGLARAGYAAGGRWSRSRVEEGRALQRWQHTQAPRPHPWSDHAGGLLLRHLLQLCSQLLWVHTRRPLPTCTEGQFLWWTLHDGTSERVHRHMRAFRQSNSRDLPTSLKLDMVLQGLWVLRVRQHIQITVWIHTGNWRLPIN